MHSQTPVLPLRSRLASSSYSLNTASAKEADKPALRLELLPRLRYSLLHGRLSPHR